MRVQVEAESYHRDGRFHRFPSRIEFGAGIQNNRGSPKAPIFLDEDAVRAHFDHADLRFGYVRFYSFSREDAAGIADRAANAYIVAQSEHAGIVERFAAPDFSVGRDTGGSYPYRFLM